MSATEQAIPTPLKRPRTFDHLRKAKKPNTVTEPIVLDPEVAVEWARLRDLVTRARSAWDEANTPEHRKALDDAEREQEAYRQAAEEAVFPMTLKGINPHAYDALISEHQPSDEQQREYQEDNPPFEVRDEAGNSRIVTPELTYDPDTFPPALLSACAVEPEMTYEQAAELFHDPNWNVAELQNLFLTCQGLCNRRQVIDLGKGSPRTRG